MSDLAATKKKMAQAIKSRFQALTVPGERSKKITASQMRLEARLKSGADLVLGCADVKAGRPPGSFGLYWMVSLTGGPVQEIMEAAGLGADPRSARPYVFTSTSHNFPSASHFEVSPTADFDAIASAIVEDMREQAFPVIEGFESEYGRALDYVLERRPGAVRKPFTTCVILMHLSGQPSRLNEIIKVAGSAQGFYDFNGDADARATIVEPLAQWFASRVSARVP